jgi:hypothetical protein
MLGLLFFKSETNLFNASEKRLKMQMAMGQKYCGK